MQAKITIFHPSPYSIIQISAHLKIAIDYAPSVHVGQSLEYARGVEFHLALGDAVALFVVHDVEQLAPLDQVQQHEHALLVLGRVDELDDEGVVDLRHDLALAAHALGLMVIDELAFDLDLEGVGLTVLLVRGEPHLPEGPGAEERVPLELKNVDRALEHVPSPRPPDLVAHATQIQNDAVDVGQRQLPEDAVLQNLDGFSALFHPPLPSVLLILVG